MSQFWHLIPLILLAVLSGCGETNVPRAEEPGNARSALLASAVPDAPTIGSIGPVTYGFAPEQLTLTEIELSLPPGYDKQVWATKLIPIERTASLGEKRCRYEMPDSETCTADKEDGLAMAMLERPLAYYRAEFAETDGNRSKIVRIQLGDCTGFGVASGNATTGVVYSFHPVGERTLLLARRFSDGHLESDPALRAVSNSIHFPEDRC